MTLEREEITLKPKCAPAHSRILPYDPALTALAAARRASAPAYDGPSGGLFSGTTGPKPPPALWLAVGGMREGGRRSVLVPADVGYEDIGSNEIPPARARALRAAPPTARRPDRPLPCPYTPVERGLPAGHRGAQREAGDGRVSACFEYSSKPTEKHGL